MNLTKLIIFTLFLSLIFISCNKKENVKIINFVPITNVTLPGDKSFEADMDSIILKGIEVPTRKQVSEGVFAFSFETEIPDSNKKYFYKIFYQNEDYKFPEEDRLSHENFYGSWGYVDHGFKEISGQNITVTDSFKIVGNPRNEQIYFGEPMETYPVEDHEVSKMIESIKSQPEWLKLVQDKAKESKRTLEEQLTLDAIFTVGFTRDKGEVNHRWKRNPRMGRYSLMLVVCSENDLKKIPDHIKDITLKDKNDEFVNPFNYFLNGEGKKLKETAIVIDTNFINLKSTLQLDNGIYIDLSDQQNLLTFDYMRDDCNNSYSMFANAHVKQFFHAQMKSYTLKTIPVIADVLADEYTVDDYNRSVKQYSDEDMIIDYIRSSDCACKTVSVKDNYVEIFNPKSTDIETARKENVGIKTRVGYTYGKFTAKIGFPSQLNSTNVWTGLTNAFWMIYQDNQEWNQRRPSKSGYTPKGSFSPDAPRMPVTNYSEIDFEMIKTSRYWPVAYPDGQKDSINEQQTDDVIVTATNFDLSSEDPVNYSGGFSPVNYKGEKFMPFRWETYYQALTVRTPVKNNELYGGDHYYYQIEWKPKEIIWRIGPSKDNLKVIAYMNDSITSIPNNQMLMIVTQEYHQTEWWPHMPFKQEYIPFLKNDLKGKVLSLEIE